MNDLRNAIISVCGIRSCTITEEIGKATISIKYSWWTYLWFGLKRKAAKRAIDYTCGRIPIGVEFSIGARVGNVKVSYERE